MKLHHGRTNEELQTFLFSVAEEKPLKKKKELDGQSDTQ